MNCPVCFSFLCFIDQVADEIAELYERPLECYECGWIEDVDDLQH